MEKREGQLGGGSGGLSVRYLESPHLTFFSLSLYLIECFGINLVALHCTLQLQKTQVFLPLFFLFFIGFRKLEKSY